MKKTSVSRVAKIVCLALITIGFAAISSHAQTVLGSFQGASDPLNAGWVNPVTGNPITTDPADSFVAAGVPGYAQSLQITGSGFNGDSLELSLSPAQRTAFNANSILSFTFSVPSFATAGATAGFSQIYALTINAPGYGFHNVGDGGNSAATWGSANFTATGSTSFNQSGEPNYYFFPGSPMGTQTVSFNYSSILASIIAGGEGYLQVTFTGNNGGGAPNYIYMNNVVLSSVPEPSTLALIGLGAAGLLVVRRQRNR